MEWRNPEEEVRRVPEWDKAKYAEHMRRFQRKVRQFSANLKLERGCARCGYNDHPDALQWDHIVPRNDGVKWMTPKTILGIERLASDPNVQVLCANCHSIKSQEERRSGVA